MEMPELHQLFLKHPNVTTDSRNIPKNSLFFALKGPNFNGNAFAKEALERGAAYSIIDEEEYTVTGKTILVHDVLATLQKLATYHRGHSKAKIIALTGSNGKTTTKELINAVLSKKDKTVATKGNLNNHIGVPLTLLNITADTEFAVIEMGANHQTEIEFLSKIAQPDFGYITNFGKAHLEGFGGVEGVIKGKSELYEYLIAHKKSIFLNADDPIQKQKLATYANKFGFGQNDQQYYTIKLLETEPHLKLTFDDVVIDTQLIGEYNFTNCCAAILMGKYFNVPIGAIKKALESYVPQNNRSQVLEKNGHQIILDAYNANPSSMKAALESFAHTHSELPKMVFLGDMFELGGEAVQEHQRIANLVAELGIKTAFLIGGHFAKTQTDFKVYPSFEALKKGEIDLKKLPKSNILIKGSRGMAMERVVEKV